jgi:hypothetical protein
MPSGSWRRRVPSARVAAELAAAVGEGVNGPSSVLQRIPLCLLTVRRLFLQELAA